MFEGILEKILLAKLGKFIMGLNKENLKVGIWGGDITLENVYIKPNALLLLQLPLFITFGKIQKLVIKVPWAKLSSYPVEVKLEGLFIIISTQEKSEWAYSEEGDIIDRKEFIESYEQRIKQLQDQKLLSAEEELKEKGFLEKISARIIDNLKISIENIHIRFESTAEGRIFSAGVILESLQCFTTNSELTPGFTDRHKVGSANICIYKLLKINSLGLYWQSQANSIYSDNELETLKVMKELIINKDLNDYLIKPSIEYIVNAQAMLIHNNDIVNFDLPQYSISLNLPDIILEYNQRNFHDTVKIFEYFVDYQQFLIKIESRKKFQLLMPDERSPKALLKGAIDCIIRTIRHRKDRSINHFAPSFKKLKYYEKKFKILHRKLKKTGMIEEEWLYHRIILLIDINLLCTWASHVQSVIEKEAKNPVGTPSKFSFWGKKLDQRLPIEESYEKIFTEIENFQLSQFSLLPKSYTRIHISLTLCSGVFRLIRPVNKSSETLTCFYSGLSSSIKYKIEGFDADLSIQNFSLVLSMNESIQEIIIKEPCSEPLWKLEFSLKPNQELSWSLFSEFQSLEVYYSPEFLRSVLAFFIVPTTQESTKVAAWDTIKGIQDNTQEILSDLLTAETCFTVKIRCSAPKIKLPSPTLQGIFQLSLGNLEIHNSSTTGHYDTFKISVSSLEMKYQPFDGIIFTIVPEFEIQSSVKLLKSKYKQKLNNTLEEIILKSKLPVLQVITTASIYHQILRLPEIFHYSLSNNESEIKVKLEANVNKLVSGLHAWNECRALLIGSYIHFYSDLEKPQEYYFIKDCNIEVVSEQYGRENTLRLRNLYGECIISFNNQKELQQWSLVLTDMVNQFESRTSMASKLDLKDKPKYRLKFKAPKMIVRLVSDVRELIAEIAMTRFQCEMKVKAFEFNFSCTLGHMKVDDGSDARLSRLFFSKKSKDLIAISLDYYDSKSQNYENKDLSLMIKTGSVKINWNYESIIHILNFFQFAEYYDPTLLLRKSLGIVEKGHSVLSFEFESEKVEIYLNNTKNQLSLAKITISGFQSHFSAQSEGYIITGVLNNITVADLTNYPKAALHEPPVPFTLFSVRENNRLLHFKFIVYSEKFRERDLDVNNKLEVQFSAIDIVYMNQPYLRIIDFCNQCIMGVFDTRSRAIIVRKSSELKPVVLQERLTFTSVVIRIKEPIIYLLPRPGFKTHFAVNLGDISIKNRLEKANNPGWLDIYEISMKNLKISSTHTPISEEFNLNMQITKKLLTSEHLKSADLCKAFNIFTSSDRIVLTLSQRDYNLLLKIIDLNLLYDDHLDLYINPNSSPRPRASGKFIISSFSFNSISIMFTHNTHPILEALALSSLVSLTKFNNSTFSYSLTSQKVFLLIPESSINSQNRDLNSSTYQVFIPTTYFNFIKAHCHLPCILCCPAAQSPENSLDISINSDLNASKTINVQLSSLRINLHLSSLQQILNFLTSGLPNYQASAHTPQDYMNRLRPNTKMISTEILKNYRAPQLNATIIFTKIFIVLPSDQKIRTLVAHSDINFMFIRNKDDNPEKADVIRRLLIEDFEVFHLNYEEIIAGCVQRMRRKVVEPIQLVYEVKEYKKTMNISQSLIIGSFSCALSYRDLLLLYSAYSFQNESMVKDSDTIKSLYAFSHIQATEDKFDISSEGMLLEIQLMHTNTVFSFAGLNIIFINDALTAYTPVLEFSLAIGDKALISSSYDGESLLKGTLQIWLSFYNPIADAWEPFIESFNLEIETKSCKTSNIMSQVVFNCSSDVLDLNISEVMIKNLSAIISTWNSSECQELISPFQIRNCLGYSMLVQYKNSEEVSAIETGNTVDYAIDYNLRDKKLWKSESITVSIYPGDYTPPKMRIKTNKVQSSVYHLGSQYIVVDVELVATRKVITVRSPLIVFNEIEYMTELRFYKGSNVEKRECAAGESCPVPYDYYASVLRIQVLGSRTLVGINLEDFWKQSKNSISEIAIGNLHFCISYKISKKNVKRRSLYIRPTLIFHNRMPQGLQLRIYNNRPSKFEELNLNPQQIINHYGYPLVNDLSFSISIEGFSRSNVIPLHSPQSPTRQIRLFDRKDHSLNVILSELQDGTNTFVFYVSQIIVNNSLSALAFYTRSKGIEFLLPGQNFKDSSVPCSYTKKMLIGLGNQRSKPFRIDTIGVQDIVELIGDVNPAGHSCKYQYTLDVQASRVLKDQRIFTKLVVISPRFIVVNNTEFLLAVAQDQMLEYPINIESGGLEPFHWASSSRKELIKVKRKGAEWGWSGAFSISNMGTFTVQSKNNSQLCSFYRIKIEVRVINSIIHVVMDKEAEETASYKIINGSGVYSMIIYQKESPEDPLFIDAFQTNLFAWSSYLLPHEVVVEFFIGLKALKAKDTRKSCVINLDKLNQNLKIVIKEKPGDLDVVYAFVCNEGPSRILRFSDMPLNNKENKSESIITYLNISIPRIGISVVEYYKHKSKELMYATLYQAVFLLQTTKNKIKAELMIKDLQADNQLSTDCIFPVILHTAEPSVRQVFHLCTVYNRDSLYNCQSFDTFEVLLQSLTLSLDTIFVTKISSFISRLLLNNSPLEDLFETIETYQKMNKINNSAISLKKIYYFKNLHINPIKIILTYVPLKEETTNKNDFSSMASFGLALAEIDSAPVRLHSLQISEVLSSEQRLKEALKIHYRSQILNELYSLIGHSNVLGNPIGLLNELGTGFIDFFYEPAQGIIKGPISTTEGLYKGTSSLIKNTVSGTFGTVSKLTSSLTAGLAVLTQDKSYIIERQKEMARNKPSNLVSGVGLGMMSFIKNVGEGIKGVVSEPIKGFKRDNIEGLMVGGLKGLSGLVVKPLTGALDIVSRSAEGIKNTTTYFDKTAEYSKQRTARAVYGTSHLIQPYSSDDALFIELLLILNPQKFSQKDFVELIIGNDLHGNSMVVGFFTDCLVYFSVNRCKVVWTIDYKGISGYEIKGGLLIKTKKKDDVLKVEFESERNVLAAQKKLVCLMQVGS